jgi:hypothetical protein
MTIGGEIQHLRKSTPDPVWIDYKTVAIAEKKNGLMRFWLLGTWIIEQMGVGLYLINLVLSTREENIESIFKKHNKENQQRKFLRST